MKNEIRARGNWAQVIALAKAMAKSLDQPKDGLVYIATDSFGGRSWTAEGPEKDRQPSCGGWYLGFDEAQLSEVAFTSATSGAVISARKEGKIPLGKRERGWEFFFQGADFPRPEKRESYYASIFHNLKLEVMEEELPYMREWIKAAYRKPRGSEA